jgi:hypothetical protein
MPEYQIREEGTAVSIELTGVEGKQRELLDAFGECQSGRCTCPTDQYEKVAAMEVEPRADEISIRLRPLEGERFDTDEIASCLDYTIEQTARDAG